MWKFGIIGCGSIADFHALAIHASPLATLQAVYGRDEQKAMSFAEKHYCQAYSNLEEMLSDPEIQIVTIATPSGAHLEPVTLAAKAGKHIICEKPLEVTLERTRKIIEVCQANNVMLSGIFNRRFSPAVSALKDAVHFGRFGRIAMCDAQIKWYRSQVYYDSGAWRGTKALDGGGALMNQGIHTIDLLLYFVGDVKRLSASTACLTHQNIEVEDSAVAILEFENGARGVIQGSTSCWSSSGLPAEIHICGEYGSVFLTDDAFRVWDFKEPHEMDESIPPLLMKTDAKAVGANDPKAMTHIGHQRNIEDVIQALERNQDPMITGLEAMRSIQVIEAIYESAGKDGEWVDLKMI